MGSFFQRHVADDCGSGCLFSRDYPFICRGNVGIFFVQFVSGRIRSADGNFSDKIGRRQTLVLSAVSLIVCLTAWAAAGQFGCTAFLFAGALFWGISDALMSGTLDALMFETAEELNQKQNFDLIYASSRLYNQAGLFVGVLLGTGIMYFWPLQILAWASIFPMTGQLVIALFYVNPKKETTEPVASAVHFKQACIELWKNKNCVYLA